MNNFDVAVIGGGSAGFAAAIKGAELGKKVALIENSTIGGTCVNIGCVPSKFVISEAFSGSDWQTIKRERDKLVEELREAKYINVLESYTDNITYFHQTAKFIDKKAIQLTDGTVLTAKKYIITTGSRPAFPDIPGISDIKAMDSTDLLFTDNLPDSLIIAGGRFIALELGQAFAKLGVKVTILQRSNYLIPQYDPEISRGIEDILKKQGINVITGTKIIGISETELEKTIVYSVNNQQKKINAQNIVFATGRKGNTDSLNLSVAEIKTDNVDHIITDKYLQSSNPRIFAAGDVLASPGLVYVAAKEGQTAAENAYADIPVALEYNNVPEVIFTHPQIAKTGITEKEALSMQIPFISTKFSISETPYGLANKITNGIIKLIKNTDNGEILGAEIMAPDAGNMIQTLTIAIKAKFTVDDIKDTYFPYLTAIEGVKLGAVIFDKDVKMLSCCAN